MPQILQILSDLDHPAYHGQVRLHGYAGKVNISQVVLDGDAAKVLQRLNPSWLKADHQRLSKQHEQAMTTLDAQYRVLQDEAAMETFGRPFQFMDYKISAIGSDEFTEEKKTALRFAAHASATHSRLSRAHQIASGRRHG